MSEPEWKTELRWMAESFAATKFLDHPAPAPSVQAVMSRYLMGALLPHIEAAYQRGLMAGRSQAGYTTRRKRKEDSCPSVTGASESTASAGEQ